MSSKENPVFIVSYIYLHLFGKVLSFTILLLIIQSFRERLASWCINDEVCHGRIAFLSSEVFL